MNIYVGNLSYNTNEDDLKEIFAQHGEVSSVKIITDKFSGQSKGFAFVEMPNQSEGEAAIKAVDGSSVGGRNLRVNEARPRTERPQRQKRF